MSNSVPSREIVALQEAKSALDATLQEQLDGAKLEYEKNLAHLEAQYSKSVFGILNLLDKADFAAQKYKLDENYKTECDFIKSVHNKAHGNMNEKLEEELTQKVRKFNYDLKKVVLAHGGELIENVKPSSIPFTKEAPQKIIEWFSAMKTMKVHSSEERIKIMEQVGYTSMFSPKPQKEVLDLLSKSTSSQETEISSVQALATQVFENPTTIIAFSTQGEKNHIGIFQDEYGIWFHDPGRLTACFLFQEKNPQAVKDEVQKFIESYQQMSYPNATHAALMRKGKAKNRPIVDIQTLVQAPAAVLHQRENLASKNVQPSSELKEKTSASKKVKKKRTR